MTRRDARTGFVLCHGFTGHPTSMQPWAHHLTAQGYDVEVPLLPGHGTTWQDLNTKRWPDFYDALEQSYLRLSARCEQVFVGGLSMGGALALRLAEHHTPAGLALVNPSLATHRLDAKLARPASWIISSTPAIGDDIKKAGVTENAYARTPLRTFVSLQQLWKVTRADLHRITSPVLVLRSLEDHVAVGAQTSQLIRDGAVNSEVTEVLLDNSYHVATLDNDAHLVFTTSDDFARSIVGRNTPPSHQPKA